MKPFSAFVTVCAMASEALDTPMMAQWRQLKQKAPDHLLFFRLGDFYELFENDAIAAAPVLGVQLTSRSRENPNAPALCGVPVANLEVYLSKALDHGFQVALAEQIELPQAGKKLVAREIVQCFTPGIRFLKEDARPHYLGVVTGRPEQWQLAAVDVAEGHIVLESGAGLENFFDCVRRLPIEDLRYPWKSAWAEMGSHFRSHKLFTRGIFLLSEEEALSELHRGFFTNSRSDLPEEVIRYQRVLGSAFRILFEAHPNERLKFRFPSEKRDRVFISAVTKTALSLFEPKGASLFDLLNRTKTSMGSRLLREWMNEPLLNVDELQKRQKRVRYFRTLTSRREDLQKALREVFDFSRLLRFKKGPLELYRLRESLSAAERAQNTFELESDELGKTFKHLLREISPFVEELKRCLYSQTESAEHGWIREGVSKELDELRIFKNESHQRLSRLEERYREEWKIPTLKIKFHQVFGFVGEVSQGQKEKLPPSVKRIQTLANVERFKTEELSELEEKILSLDARLSAAEGAELARLIELLSQYEDQILSLSDLIGELDATASLSEVSDRFQWKTPELASESLCELIEARHPLSQEDFVPLSLKLCPQQTQLLLLTGPNMSGKSTVLRLTALAALLHQMGSDVPAVHARLSLFDRILCRMGASDDFHSGRSTFFVEMREVATMLEGANERSLLLFDEIGRGTSTYDGVSLAWAIAKYVHRLNSLSLMATHYLELAELERELSHLRCVHLGVEEENGRLIFTRRLEMGPASKSYGIHVAELADLPSVILEEARAKLKGLEAPSSERNLVAVEKPESRITRKTLGPLFELYPSAEGRSSEKEAADAR